MISVGVIQTRLGITGDDAHLAELEEEVVADVETWTGLYLGTASKTFREVHTGGRARARLTPSERERLPSVRLGQRVESMAGITSVEWRDAPDQLWEAYPLTDPDPSAPLFDVDDGRLFKLRNDWPPGRRTVRVSYDFHWAEDAAPPDVRGVVLDVIKRRYESPQLRATPESVASVSVRGVAVKLDPSRANGTIPEALKHRVMQLRRFSSFGGARAS